MVTWITSRFTASLADSYSLWPLALGKYKGFSSSFLPCAMCCENCSTPYPITALFSSPVFSVSGIASQNVPQNWAFMKQTDTCITKWCESNQARQVTWGYGRVTAPKRWYIISHLFVAGPVCLLPRRQRQCSGGATERGLSCSPLQWHYRLGGLCNVSGQRHPGGATLLTVFMDSSSCTVCQFCCSLVSLIRACIIVDWWPDGRPRPECTPTPSHPQHGGVRAACVNTSTGWRQSTDCLPRQLIVVSRNRTSSALHFCIANSCKYSYILSSQTHCSLWLLFSLFVYLQYYNYCITWCYCYSILLAVGEKWWLGDCYGMLILCTWCLCNCNVNLFN